MGCTQPDCCTTTTSVWVNLVQPQDRHIAKAVVFADDLGLSSPVRHAHLQQALFHIAFQGGQTAKASSVRSILALFPTQG
jgi:hypothetical protein